MGQIKVRGKMQRVAVINDNRVVARAVRYSTVKGDELTSYAAQSSHIPESTLRACTLAMREAINSHGDRYLGMTAAMTQAPVPSTTTGQKRKWQHCETGHIDPNRAIFPIEKCHYPR